MQLSRTSSPSDASSRLLAASPHTHTHTHTHTRGDGVCLQRARKTRLSASPSITARPPQQQTLGSRPTTPWLQLQLGVVTEHLLAAPCSPVITLTLCWTTCPHTTHLPRTLPSTTYAHGCRGDGISISIPIPVGIPMEIPIPTIDLHTPPADACWDLRFRLRAVHT